MKPYYEHGGITIYHADAREAYREIGYSEDHSLFLDPPYNVKKAEWDYEFPYWLFDIAAQIGPTLAVTPGTNNLLRCPSALCGIEYRWCLSAHLINGATRGQISFANWIPCLLYARPGLLTFKPRQDCKDFPILNDPKPDHPCPKPYNVMRWLLSFLLGATIVDFLMGSGTTLRAAKDLGRKAGTP